MYQVLIADDESRIRQGIRKIVNWAALGYQISGEAANGEEALSIMIDKAPDIVLIDIRMPKLSGLEAIKAAQEAGFEGKIIILSGYSDFSYAQQAIALGVKYYLTKPINEAELEKILIDMKQQFAQEEKQKRANNHYFERAKESVLKDLLINPSQIAFLDLVDINAEKKYQVVLCEKYNQNSYYAANSLAKLLRLGSQSSDNYEYLTLNQVEVFILKGDEAIARLNSYRTKHLENRLMQDKSIYDSLFFTYGQEVSRLADIHMSYHDAKLLLEKRFFCEQDQHFIGYDSIDITDTASVPLDETLIRDYKNRFVESLAAFNRNMLAENLHMLEKTLYAANIDVRSIKFFLIDLYLLIKETITQRYSMVTIPFSVNSWAIDFMNSRKYLYEIIRFYSEQFDMILSLIGNSSRDSVLDDVINYIDHHYMSQIRLENIAPLFGYNCSYLGKIFKQKMDVSFNTYLDSVRINHAKKLLEGKDMKVYEVAQKVGYSNVDYFYLKFKKHVGTSPAEYRRVLKGS